MQSFSLWVSAFGLLLVGAAAGQTTSVPIRLNSLGYLPDYPKRATVAGVHTNFSVVEAQSGKTVFSGTAKPEGELSILDFSGIRKPGRYSVEVPGIERSPEFRIGPSIYQEPFVVVTRGMYLWRCGTAVAWTNANGVVFSHEACHTNDAWMDYVTGQHEIRPSPGGWHDAGDYNKYVVNAGITVGAMLRAWEDFGEQIRQTHLGLPGSARLPELLREIQFEADWLLTMQLPNGSVSHKVSTLKFGGFVLPEKETAPRYFTDWSTAATADLAAMLAQSSRALQPYAPESAKLYLEAARRSYAFLQTIPTNRAANLSAFSTGPYQTRDQDDRLWAAAELWESTGDPGALKDLDKRLRETQAAVQQNFDWSDVGNLGVFTYLASKRDGRDPELVSMAGSNVIAAADAIVAAARTHAYERPLGNRYYWGCNGTVARQVLILEAAHRLSPNREYRVTGASALNHLLGRNVHGRSYVTGLGYRPPMHPHDRRAGGDSVAEPWPGYLVGGPHPRPENWTDEEADFRTNEIAINWNGALIYALAAFLSP